MYSGYEYLKALSDYIGEVGDFSATEAILTSIDNEEHTDFRMTHLNMSKTLNQSMTLPYFGIKQTGLQRRLLKRHTRAE